MSRRRDLDRDALFKNILGDLGGEPTPQEGLLSLDLISFKDDQPRRHFDDDALQDLADSIRKRGVLEPVLVRPVGGRHELIAGERRARAARLAGLTEIPAVILDVDDHAALEISIMENLQREDLNAVEETEAVLNLLELNFGYGRKQVTALLQEVYNEERGRSGGGVFEPAQKAELRDILARLGRFTPSSFYVNRIPILDFPRELLDAVRSGRLEFTKAQAIARVRDPGRRQALLEEAIAEGLSLSQIRARVARSSGKTTPSPDSKVLARTRRLLTTARLEKLGKAERSRAESLIRELRELLES